MSLNTVSNYPPRHARILILSCNTGEGHNSCAAALKEAFDRRNVSCDVEDGLRFVSPAVSKLVSKAHVWIYRHAPCIFRALYRFSEKHASIFAKKSPLYIVLASGAGALAAFVSDGGYDAVLCTHVFAGMILREACRRHHLIVKTAFVATDYTAHPSVRSCAPDLCFIPDPSLAEEFCSKAVTADRIFACGIPVCGYIYPRRDRAFARECFSIPQDCRHLLVMGGSMGCGPIPQIVEKVAGILKENQMVSVLCGTNHKLRMSMEEKFKDHDRIRIHGFVEDLSLLMDSADLYLTKPGGLSITEAAVKNLPMVLVDAVAGCESYNRDFFLSLGIAATARTPEDLAQLCAKLLGDDARLEEMRAAGSRLNWNAAADTICESVLKAE